MEKMGIAAQVYSVREAAEKDFAGTMKALRECGYEGVNYKNLIGTCRRGSLLPKNPQLCDYLIQKALERKYGSLKLPPLDDSQEQEANTYMVQRLIK